jgi:hypothetical protein
VCKLCTPFFWNDIYIEKKEEESKESVEQGEWKEGGRVWSFPPWPRVEILCMAWFV